MTAFVATDVTYTVLNQRKLGDSRNLNRVRLAFGDGALTYAAGGIPLTIGKLGCPTVVESLIVVDQGTSGYKFAYDQSASKLVITQAPVQTHTHDLFILGAGASDDANTRVNAATNVLGTNAGANITVAGSGANGGIVSTTLAAAGLTEVTSVAIAAQTIEVEVIGW